MLQSNLGLTNIQLHRIKIAINLAFQNRSFSIENVMAISRLTALFDIQVKSL
jgi:hypothetical protein